MSEPAAIRDPTIRVRPSGGERMRRIRSDLPVELLGGRNDELVFRDHAADRLAPS